MQLVAARFPDHHDSAAVRTAVFWGIGIDVDLELGHAVDNRIVDHLSRLRLQDADPVIDVFVSPRAAAIDARQELAGGKSHARRERHQGNEAAAVEGQGGYLFFIDIEADLTAGRLQQRRRCGDIDRLRRLPDVEPYIDGGPIRQPQNDPDCLYVRKPGCSTVTTYWPAGNPTMWYSPRSFEVQEYRTIVADLRPEPPRLGWLRRKSRESHRKARRGLLCGGK